MILHPGSRIQNLPAILHLPLATSNPAHTLLITNPVKSLSELQPYTCARRAVTCAVFCSAATFPVLFLGFTLVALAPANAVMIQVRFVWFLAVVGGSTLASGFFALKALRQVGHFKRHRIVFPGWCVIAISILWLMQFWTASL